MKDHFNEESSSDLSFTNSFGSDKSPNVDFSVTEKPKDDRTVSVSGEAFVIPESLRLSGFRIVKLLGRGGMGVVYEAIEEELNRRVALKVLPASALLDSKQISRFKHEARAVAQLHHENIVPIYKVGSDQGIHYYTMQLIEGQNLSQIISSIKNHIKSDSKSSREDTKRRSTAKTKEDRKKEDRSPGVAPGSSSRRRFKIEELASALSSRRGSGHDLSMYQSIAEFGAEIATALSHAHEHGVIHRDIKPSNILVDETSKPWVADFGLAMVRDNSVATKPGDIVGTYRYMSPEQATGRRFLIDHRTDIYSLGVTLYELVTQSVPFPGTEPHELLRQVSFDEPKSVRSANPAIPEELQIIITKAIAKNPHDRYETAHDFADDLRRFATGRPIQAKRASIVKQVRRWIGRHQGFVFAASLVLLMTFITSIAASAMIWNAYESEHNQLVIAEIALNRSEGTRLAAISQQLISLNPCLALCLAEVGAQNASGPEINNSLINALSETYERKALYPKNLIEQSLRISPDGRLAAGLQSLKESNSGSAIIIDLTEGKINRTFDHQAPFTEVIFHPTSNYILTSSSNELKSAEGRQSSFQLHNAILWDVRKDDAKIVLKDSEPKTLKTNCFSRDGKIIVLPSSENTASVYDGTTGERLLQFQQHKESVIAAVISSDGRKAASLDLAGELILWTTTDATALGKLELGPRSLNAIPQLNLTRSGDCVIVTNDEGSISYDFSRQPPAKIAKWREPRLSIHPNLPIGVCYWNASNTLQIRNLLTGQSLSKIKLGNAPRMVSYTADGRYILAVVDSHVHAIEPLSGKEIFSLKGHSRAVLSVSSDHSFESILTSSQDHSVRVWSTNPILGLRGIDQQPLTPVPTRDHWSYTEDRFAFATQAMYESAVLDGGSSKLRTIESGAHFGRSFQVKKTILFQDHEVQLFDATASRKLQEISFPNSHVVEASFCGSTDNVLVKLRDQQWYLWNTTTASISQLQLGRSEPTKHSISPDNTKLVVTGHDGLCTVHDLMDGRLLSTLPHEEDVTELAWTKELGVFTLDAKGYLRRWKNDSETKEPAWTVDTDGANSIELQEKSQLIISYHGLLEKEIRCWGLESGKLQHSTNGFRSLIVRLHPTEPLAVLASTEQGASLWNLGNGELTELTKTNTLTGGFVKNEVVLAELGIEKHAHMHPTFFLSDSGTSALNFFDLTSKVQSRTIPLNRTPTDLSFDQDSDALLLTYASWHAAIYERRSQDQHLSPSFASNVSAIRNLPQNKRWIVASSDGTALLLDSNGKMLRTFDTTGHPIITICVSGDESKLAICDLQGGLRILEIETGKNLLTENTHQSPIRQAEFIDQGQAVLSLSESGKVIKTNLDGSPSLNYSTQAGIHTFTVFKDQLQALLICATDKLDPPIVNGSATIAASAANVTVGPAELLDLKKLESTTIQTNKVLSGDVNLETSQLCLLTDSAKLQIYGSKGIELRKEIDVSSHHVESIRWIAKNRVASLSKNNSIAVWDTLDGTLTSDLPSSNRGMHSQTIFRSQWNPLDPWGESLITTDSQYKFMRYPVDPVSFARRNLPRSLNAEESARYLNPLIIKDRD